MLTINNTLDGYLKDVEIKGNTVQDASNLADIRSVGEKIEGQELYEIPVLSCGKNLFDIRDFVPKTIWRTDGTFGASSESNGGTKLMYINPNTKYAISNTDWSQAFFFDRNKNIIGVGVSGAKTFETPSNCHYIAFNIRIANLENVQLEEGTVATPYEPYQEDKLTILSPVQLEKVGDVADRIICKDGVWGVEKNVTGKLDLLKATWIRHVENDNNLVCKTSTYSDVVFKEYSDKIISNFTASIPQAWNGQTVGISTFNDGWIYLCVPKTLVPTIDNLSTYLNNVGAYAICRNSQPQFIPLPHDQQVKLRTFASKTNISFGCEIEGTIKAQVPKSIGATVNTHTEQINNLNKELDRVKKLEESTVSTIETESDFTTVEATSGGYFEDVKLEGKTLVNCLNVEPNVYTSSLHKSEIVNGYHKLTMLADGDLMWDLAKTNDLNLFKPSTYYTFIVDVKTNTTQSTEPIRANTSLNCMFTNGGSSNSYIKLSELNQTGVFIYKYKSEPNFTINNIKLKMANAKNGGVLEYRMVILEGDHTQNPPSYFEGLKSVGQSASEDGADEIVVSSVNSDNTKSDKKRLLYYNDETQTWEKPILRQWDSIEKHADGKYYYHKRSGEIVLNGSENVNLHSTFNNTCSFTTVISDICANTNNGTVIDVMCDKLVPTSRNDNFNNDVEGISNAYLSSTDKTKNGLFIRILKSKLSTQDVQGFKQWLQANNVTVVYQLAQEKIYECTNIDLITYASETNYIVESGAIVPKTTLKVHNNISNVVNLLQKKVSLLESDLTKYMITQNRLQLSSAYSADSVTFKVDYYTVCSENRSQENYNTDLYNLILNNILVGKDNYDYDHMFNIIMDYASWSQISWGQFDILVGIMDLQHNPPIEPPIEEVPSETPEE